MKNLEKEVLFDVIHNCEQYFIPISFNDDWNDIGVLDKVKLCMLLDGLDYSYCCGYSFVNGEVWSIQITFAEEQKSSLFSHSTTSSFPQNKELLIKSIELYVSKVEIKTLRKIVFFEDKSSFWGKL